MKLDVAYLAGVVDSDGSLTISRQHNKTRPNPSFTPTFQLSWVESIASRKVMELLKTSYGGSISKSKSQKGRFKNARPIIKYCITSRKLKAFLLDVAPYLRLKKSQADLCLKLILLTESGNKSIVRKNSMRIKIQKLNKGIL